MDNTKAMALVVGATAIPVTCIAGAAYVTGEGQWLMGILFLAAGLLCMGTAKFVAGHDEECDE